MCPLPLFLCFVASLTLSLHRKRSLLMELTTYRENAQHIVAQETFSLFHFVSWAHCYCFSLQRPVWCCCSCRGLNACTTTVCIICYMICAKMLMQLFVEHPFWCYSSTNHWSTPLLLIDFQRQGCLSEILSSLLHNLLPLFGSKASLCSPIGVGGGSTDASRCCLLC